MGNKVYYLNLQEENFLIGQGIDFYAKLGKEQPLDDKIEGLLHHHNALSGHRSLGRVTLWLQEIISAKTSLALKMLASS